MKTRDVERLGVVAAIVALQALSACASGAGGARLTPIAAADSFARAAVQQEASLDPSTYPRFSVAVPPLRIDARDSSLQVLGYGLADLLMTDLARSSQLVVVDRLRLDAVLRELQLAAAGRVDSTTAPRAGKLVGARTLVVGEIRDAADGSLDVSTRLVDAVAASVGGGPTTRAPLNGILDAQKRLALDLFDRLGVTLTPREQQLVNERPTQNLAALLAYSRGVRSEAMGDLRAARDEYRAAASLDRGFRSAQQRATAASEALGEPVASDAATRLAPLTGLSTDLVNRPSVPIRSDLADPAFNSVQRLVTLIITVNIP